MNKRASESTGARANALAELRIVKNTSAIVIPDSLQLKARNQETFLLSRLELGERVLPASSSHLVNEIFFYETD